MNKDNRNHVKRIGTLFLCLVLVLTLGSGIGTSVAAYADDSPEAETVIEPEGIQEESEITEVYSDGEDETQSEPQEEVAEEGSTRDSESASFEFVSDFRMNSLVAGYTQAEANARKKDIILENTGDIALNIDPSKLNVDTTQFSVTYPDEIITIQPGESAVIGSIKPRHQLKPGIYKSELSLYDSDYKAYARTSLSLTILSRSTDILITTENNAPVSSAFLGYGLEGSQSEASKTFLIYNDGNCKVRFNLSSDYILFNPLFTDEGVTSDTLFAPGEFARIKISVNPRTASSLEAGGYLGEILVTAVSEDGGSSSERKLSVEYDITGKPCWRSETVSDAVSESYSSIAMGLLYIENTQSISGSLENYVMAELDEGDDVFNIQFRSGGSSYMLTTKSALSAGTYVAKLDLYFDPAGNVDAYSRYYCGTCTYTLTIYPDDNYSIDIINETDKDDYIFLGILKSGYTAEDAAKLRKPVQIKNTGREALNVSSAGLKVTYGGGSFEYNETQTEKLEPGEEYDKIWLQPVTGLKPGNYTADICFYDDEQNAVTDDYEVKFLVLEEGISYQLLLSGGVFDYDVEIGPEGVDFGTAAPGSASKTVTKYIYFNNFGSVPVTVSTEITDNESGIFSENKPSESIVEPGDRKRFRIDCDPSGVAEIPGKYTANLKVYAVNTEDSGQSKAVSVPLTFAVENEETCKLTLDFQGKGGPDYPDTSIDVAIGSKYSDGITKIMRQITKVKYGSIPWPTDDDYTMICLSKKTDAELAELGTWEAAAQAQDEIQSGTVTQDTTVYVNWAKKINDTRLSIDVPSCGDAIPNKPVVKVAEQNAHYSVAEASWRPFEDTTFIAGNSYGISIKLTADFGYALSGDCECKLNEKAAVNTTASNSTQYSTFEASVTAQSHVLGEWYPAGNAAHAAKCSVCKHIIKQMHDFDDGVEVVEAKCVSPGKMKYTCSVCGYEHFEEIPPLGHELINKTLVTKTDDSTSGTFSYVCKHCGEEYEEDFWYAATEGNNAIYYRDCNNMLNITFKRFSECWNDPDMTFDFNMNQPILQFKLDGKLLEHGLYTLTTMNEIETKIGLFADTLNTLSDGEHTLEFIYEDGSRTAFFNIKTPKYIDTIDIDIKPPVCGESASYGWDQYSRLRVVNPPVITLPDNCGYSIAEFYSVTRWTDENNTSFWEGSFKGGEPGYASFCLVPDEGYAFVNEPSKESYYQIFSGTFRVNGKEVTPVRNRYVSYVLTFIVPVDAVHNLSGNTYQWAGDNSSVTASAKCQACGETVTEKAATTSKVTKQATYTSTGIRTYTAVFQNAAFKKQTKKVTIPKKAKLANTMTAKGSTKTVDYAKLQNKSQTVKNAITVKKAKGTVTYKMIKGDPKITVNKKTGNITVKKGLKKGRTYTIKVKVTASGTSTGSKQYKKGEKNVKVKITVK